ncbi:hypothetical protein HAX54_047206 [Datura stramonium]|uniref:Uncharacterized protein n=1 Tax=Datura stramonium TaxID=4076 RepID=A0ABS8SSM4_DATST|nr:hypothetical protein [Datura stramonium]
MKFNWAVVGTVHAQALSQKREKITLASSPRQKNYCRSRGHLIVLAHRSGRSIASAKLLVRKPSWTRTYMLSASFAVATTGLQGCDTTSFYTFFVFQNWTIHGLYWGSHKIHQPNVLGDSLEELLSWLSKGLITINISHTFSLAEAHLAFTALKDRRAIGKVMITFDDGRIVKSKL